VGTEAVVATITVEAVPAPAEEEVTVAIVEEMVAAEAIAMGSGQMRSGK